MLSCWWWDVDVLGGSVGGAFSGFGSNRDWSKVAWLTCFHLIAHFTSGHSLMARDGEPVSSIRPPQFCGWPFHLLHVSFSISLLIIFVSYFVCLWVRLYHSYSIWPAEDPQRVWQVIITYTQWVEGPPATVRSIRLLGYLEGTWTRSNLVHNYILYWQAMKTALIKWNITQ